MYQDKSPHLSQSSTKWRWNGWLCSYSFRKAIKQAKRQYRDKVELQFNGSDTRGMWQGLQSITDYKKKTSPVAVLLPDRLNNFFAHFEDNTVPLTWPATKACGLSLSMANVNKTCKCVNPRKAACPDGISSHVLRACADQLAGVLGHIQSIPIPVCCFHMLQEGHPLFLFTRKLR